MSSRPLTVVALSGGVDSATAAALLVEQGERVVGVTMRLYDPRGTSAAVGRCCGPRDVEDARRVASHLGIPFYVVDHSAEFVRTVIADFIAEYGDGRTPNPCVRCNEHIKFTPLWRWARAIGATSLVTGHYARIVDTDEGRQLARARDANKDQSYFLFAMPRSALSWVRFPLGELTKEQVRQQARRLGLPNSTKAESQEICFIPDGDHAAFVAAQRPEAIRPGAILDGRGGIVGRHDGVHRFTVGQRRGLGSARPSRPGETPRPRYVVAIDPRAATITVGEAGEVLRREMVVDSLVLWQRDLPATARVQIRHRHPAQPASLHRHSDGPVEVHFTEPQRAPAPGQAAVFYVDERVIGGGFIASPSPDVVPAAGLARAIRTAIRS